MEDILKAIVWDLNELVKKYRKDLITDEGQKIFLKKLDPHWPLKRGSVAKRNLAWNTLSSASETIQGMTAFLIKNTAVLRVKKQDSKIQIFENPYCAPFFWSEVKKYYTLFSFSNNQSLDRRSGFVEKTMPRNCCVTLCLEDTFFRMRSGMNQELTGFEYFLEDLFNANNSLIVFSMQNLIQANEKMQINNYSISFKMNKDATKSSLQQVMEPSEHALRSAQFIGANKTGCFDRLVDLLGMGQKFASAIDNHFSVGY